MVMQLASRVTQPQALHTRLGERLQSSSFVRTRVPLQGKMSVKSFPVASFPTMGNPLLSLLFRIREKAGGVIVFPAMPADGGRNTFFLLFSIIFADQADKHEARCGRCRT